MGRASRPIREKAFRAPRAAQGLRPVGCERAGFAVVTGPVVLEREPLGSLTGRMTACSHRVPIRRKHA